MSTYNYKNVNIIYTSIINQIILKKKIIDNIDLLLEFRF